MSILSFFEKKESVKDKTYETLSEKYAPISLSEFMGNYKSIQMIHTWFQSKKPALLLVGPCGSGKSKLIELFIKYYNINSYENNSTNKRSKKELSLWYEKLKRNTDMILIIDELETLVTKNENMTVTELAKWIHPSYIRIIFIVNIHVLNKVNGLKLNPLCSTVYVDYPDPKSLYAKCLHIFENESIDYTNETMTKLKNYIANLRCEPRSIIDGLMMMESIEHEKDQEYDIYNAYQLIMDKSINLDKKMIVFSVDSGTIPILFHENYIDMNLSITERCKVGEYMANADVFHKKVFMHVSKQYMDIYATMSSIFHELIHNETNKNQPRFGLIWTKQSAMYQKKKYITCISQELKSPFVTQKDLFHKYLIFKHIVNEYRKDFTDIRPIQSFIDENKIETIDTLFYIYICFNTSETIEKKSSDVKTLTKKLFHQYFSNLFKQ